MFWLIWVSLNWIWRPGQLIGLWSLLFIITTQDLKEFLWDWSTWAFAYLNFSVPLLIHLDSRYFLISVCHCGAWPTCEICCLIAKLCPTLCYVMDCSPPGSSVCGILQARILEWVAISFSSVNFSSSSLVAKLCLTLATPQTVACHVPLSMGFSRQEYWSGLPLPSPVWRNTHRHYWNLLQEFVLRSSPVNKWKWLPDFKVLLYKTWPQYFWSGEGLKQI